MAQQVNPELVRNLLPHFIARGDPPLGYASDADVSDPPTDGELDAAYDTPANLPERFMGILDDNGASSSVWLVVTSNGAWQKLQFGTGGGSPHDPVTLDANADTILSLSVQELGLDTQVANAGFLGPVGGGAAVPSFRALDAADISTPGDALYVRRDGTLALTANWDAGGFEIRARTLESDVATGTSPLTIASTTVVTNLNADLLDGNHASAFPQTSLTLTAGAGLTGGGDLSANRTFDVGAGDGITVNANDVALTTPGTITVATANSSAGNHTHAATTTFVGAVSTIVATNASGGFTLTGTLEIDVPTATETGLILKTTDDNSASGESLLDVQDSAGATLLRITPAGRLVFDVFFINEATTRRLQFSDPATGGAEMQIISDGASHANASLRIGTKARIQSGADSWVTGGGFGIGTTTPGTTLEAVIENAVTAAVTNVVTIGHNSSGTPASDFGVGLVFELGSATTDSQLAGRLAYQWRTATHDTRNAYGILTAHEDGTERECIAWEADGGGPKVGLYGVTPVAQSAAYTRNATIVEDRTLLASASATTTNNNNVLAALIADLQNIGILG